MNLPLNAPQAAMLASPVVELRQYTLNPGQRETLIALFDREFIESQEATGVTIIGQFRDLDRPDMFVWLRGFGGMDARKEGLAAFYDGPIWAAHRDAANARSARRISSRMARQRGAGIADASFARPARNGRGTSGRQACHHS